jgi:RHS repeat-associated protein
MIVRFVRIFTWAVVSMLLAAPLFASFCVPGTRPPQSPPPDPPPPVCEPKACDKCSKSPCYLATGTYVSDFVDLQIPTAGMYPLTVSRRYDSSRPADGPLGVGWSSSLTAHLYYATYLVSAPSTYSYEADIVMPDGVVYRFTTGGGSEFTPPFGRYDSLVKNGDGTYSLTLQHSRSVYRFNADGSLASLTDDYGNVISYTNDASGRIQRMADSAGSGRYIDVTWGADGRIASFADNAGRVSKYFYENGNGTLSSFSDPLVASDTASRSAYYTYVSGRFGPVLSRIADCWHRVISDLDWFPNGKLKSYTEGTFDGSATSPGEKYSYAYSPSLIGGSVTKTDSFATTNFNYSDSNTGLVNGSTTSYDVFGNVATDSSSGGFRSYEYGMGNILKMTSGGVTWWYAYDTNFPDKIVSIIAKDTYGNPRTDWAGWTYAYNAPGTTAAGALATVYRVRSDTTTKDRVASYTYDSHGHVMTFSDDNRLMKTFAYNAAGDLTSVSGYTTTYGYDSLGRQTSMTSPDGNVTTYTYDARDRIATVTLPKPTATSTLNFVTVYSYDNYDSTSGLVFTTVTDPNGRVTRSGYDALGHLVQATDAAGTTTTFTYQNNLAKTITDANGNATSYTYNANRELSGTTFPDGTSESYVITNGVVSSKTDRKGQQVSYSYDTLGRIVRAGFYNSAGAWVGQVYTYANSNAGQNLVEIDDYQPAATATYQFSYDASFRRTVQTIAGGEKTTYTYTDPAGFAGSLVAGYTIAPAAGTSGTTQSVTYGYDALNRVGSIAWSWIPGQPFTISYIPSGYSRITYPNGQTRMFSYDNQGRMTNVTNNDPQGNLLASFDYGYDHDWTDGTDTIIGQRTSVNVAAVAGTYLEAGLTKYGYDTRYQLARQDHPNGSYETWAYDAIGNRTSWRTMFGTTIGSTFFKNGTNPNNGQRLRNDGNGSDYTYDANGNVTRSSPGDTFAWDYANRLTSYVSAYSSAAYSYDYLGRRRSTTVNGFTTRYISEGTQTAGERNTSTGVSTDYLFGPGIDEPLAKHMADGSIWYYGADGLGSMVVMTYSSGILANSNRYTAWGQPAVTNELFGYTGRENGGPSWFYRARYYDAATGRFLNEDPLLVGPERLSRAQNLRASAGPEALRFVLANNVYAYAVNSPARFRDPSGLDAEGCDMVPWCMENRRTLNCCYQHDQCYFRNKCSAWSWETSWPPACQLCNLKVACCFSGLCSAPPAPQSWLDKAYQNDPPQKLPPWPPEFSYPRYPDPRFGGR